MLVVGELILLTSDYHSIHHRRTAFAYGSLKLGLLQFVSYVVPRYCVLCTGLGLKGFRAFEASRSSQELFFLVFPLRWIEHRRHTEPGKFYTDRKQETSPKDCSHRPRRDLGHLRELESRTSACGCVVSCSEV